MLTNITIRNFKRLADVNFELGKTVILIGPNNAGKTTALQALSLWDVGHRLWISKRAGRSAAEKRPGVTINRRDLSAIPVPVANLLWHDLHVRNIERVEGRQKTNNIMIEVTIDGVTDGKPWSCGFEFDYANEESFYCRPLRLDNGKPPERMSVPQEAAFVKIEFLPTMSGLADREFIKQTGEIKWLIGQGQTAQVLRNLCFRIFEDSPESWKELVIHIQNLFGAMLMTPVFIKERAEIIMSYKEPNGNRLDLSSGGRGFQQTLLLLAHLYANPGTVLLLDEPDAHLEVLRQRQTYQLLTEVAGRRNSQIIAASHSEVILNEAADRDMVIAFVGAPHRIDDRGSQVLKSLKDIGFDQYYLAEETGWVIYLEGSTDLAILKAFAKTLGHKASSMLERAFVRYIGTNIPEKARQHFYGLREAKNNLLGIAIFDSLDKELQKDSALRETMWKKREIENYVCMKEILMAYARYDLPDDLFGRQEADRREIAMAEAITEISSALKVLRRTSPWSPDIKATDDFLDPLFEKYFEKLGLQNLLRKTDYHVLAALVPAKLIDPEVIEKLDAIVEVAEKAGSSFM